MPAALQIKDPPTLPGRTDMYLGRQPILDRSQELYAFELLFRSGGRNAAVIDDDVKATATVINNAFNELGIESVLGRYRGFINLTQPLLMSDMIEVLPRDKVVLEVLETVVPTPQVAARCLALRKMGFSLALDDVVSADDAFECLLPAVELIKIDLKGVAAGALPDIVGRYRARGLPLLAEKVDTREEAEQCIAMGFSYFQGYYFARPEIISGKKLAPTEMALLRLLGLVLADAEQGEIEQALKREPTLSVNLLRLANSVASGLRRHTESIGSAVMLLGRRQLQRWLQLLLYSAEPNRTAPTPLMQLAAVRGRLMETLAPHAIPGKGAADLAFITGIMSLMETLLSRPLAEIMATLPVPADVSAALLERRGPLGEMLTLCERLESGEPGEITLALSRLPGMMPETVNAAQADAMRWANSIADQSE